MGTKRKRDGFTKTEKENMEVQQLEKRIAEETPERGSKPAEIVEFDKLPISGYTKSALRLANFNAMTEIQQAAIPHALAGRDVLGAAKTGSGKTLAFIIPIVENLFRLRWDKEDGLGALIISPIRELALQIFEVLRTVGKFHDLSAGLVIGGKDFKEEQGRIVRMNILICSPGRLLQHCETTPGFEMRTVKMLVLDEADRILDLGFQKDLTSILTYMNKGEYQTLLFSATQTKSVKDLARLNLKDPEYIGVHDKSEFATPKELNQKYAIVELHDKVDTLWSFIKSHLKNKTLVFVSTAKQVRFIFEAFRKQKPGVPLMGIHGRMKQTQRMIAYYEFLEKPSAVMICTDVAARGLDWPGIDWVFQLDCPEDTATYIHRVGRTARFRAAGNALMLLLPSERAMAPLLGKAKIPIDEIAINPSRTKSMKSILRATVAESTELKHLAQRAFVSYLRCVHLMANKEVFNTADLPINQFAESLGLGIVPKVKFLTEETRTEAHSKKDVNHKLNALKEKIKAAKAEKKAKRIAEAAKVAPAKSADDTSEEEEAEEEELLEFKGTYDEAREAEMAASLAAKKEADIDEAAKPKRKKQKLMKGTSKVTKFDDDGEMVKPMELMISEEKPKSMSRGTIGVIPSVDAVLSYQEVVAKRLADAESSNREMEKDRLKAKRLKAKQRGKTKGDESELADEEAGAGMAVLGNPVEEEGEGSEPASGEDDEGSGDEDDASMGSGDEGTMEEDIAQAEAKALKLLQSRRG